jgi:3-oxoadipate enol-lactonase
MTGTITTGDGCRIAYRFDGPTAGPVLLLSSSLGTTMDMWEPQLAAFAQQFRILRYDTRGHGRSDAPAGGYSLDRLGRDVVELLDALEIPRVHFCGLSLGGMVGQWLGLRVPERIERLVLAHTSAFMGPPSAWDGRIAVVRERGMGAVADASIERWFTAEFVATDDASLDKVRAMLLAVNVGGYTGCCAAIRDMDLRRLGGLIDLPTLIIGGDADPATPPAHSEALADAICGSRLLFLSAAHLGNMEQPTDFADAVLDFLAPSPGEVGKAAST